MTRKIFQSIIAVVISVLLLSLALITGVLYNHFETTMLDQLRTTAQFAEQGVEQEGMAMLLGTAGPCIRPLLRHTPRE